MKNLFRRLPHSNVWHRSILSILLSLLIGASRAQLTAAEIDPNFASPELAELTVPQRVLVLPDDSFLVYWTFNRFNGQNAGLVLKFKPDGTLDPTFRFTGPYFHVIALTPAPGGKFIVAVRRIDKTSFSYPILRLNADGSVDESFNAGAGANRDVYALAVQSDGNILVGGTFDMFNGQARQGIVRLLPNGGIDSSFAAVEFQPDQTTGPHGIRSKIIVQPDGKIVIGGSFFGVNGTNRNGVARLEPNGSLDPTFVPTALRTGTGGHQPIFEVELQPDGKILAAGRFAPSGSSIISPLVRMSAEGAVERYFPGRPNQTSPPSIRPVGRAIKLLPSGDTIVAGDRLYLYSAEGAERTGSQRTTISSFALGLDATSDGRILIAGDRSSFANEPNSGVKRFSPEGVRDTSFNLGEFQREALPRMIAVRSDGEIWLTGSRMQRVNGVPRRGAARLNRDGTLDAFQTSGGIFNGISVESDERIVLFGASFYRRFDDNGNEDPSFGYDTSLAPFDALLPASGGRHFVLTSSTPAVLNDIVVRQLRDDGLSDESFRFGIKFSEAATSDDARVVYVGENQVMATYPNGRFLFRYFDNSGNYRLARFNSDASVDPTFETASVPAVLKTEYTDSRFSGAPLVKEAAALVLTDVLLLPDGKVIAVGMFKQFNGVAAPGIVRVAANGSVDPTFNPGTGAGWVSTVGDETQLPRIDAVERLSNGKLLITGDFESFDGVEMPGIARLNPDGSLDRTFVSPVARQAETTTPADDLFAWSPVSKLIAEAGGTILLSGNYAPTSGGPARALVRLQGLTETVALNISTRLNVQTGENVMIGGFIITGNAPKKVLVRGLGTSLTQAGIVGALADPTLELIGDGRVIASNDNWKESQEAEIASSGVAPRSDFESAIVRTFSPGAYTAVVRGRNNGTGVALVELYDLDQAADAKLANISTRGLVQTGENVMIGGFILGGSGLETNVLVRALGPSLGDDGVAGALQDPTLELYDKDGSLVAENDNWKSTQEAAIKATTIPPKRNEEAAILAPLRPGAYTAIVRGKNNTTGVGLVEVYNVQ
ncbi:MAG TPA: hypothetical protein VK993_15770 [Chthoniobacterales bacterium]|nr:hypothetical protein [Chthoniobacterales bacterium]